MSDEKVPEAQVVEVESDVSDNYADVFGGQFPVCNADQKVAIEAAFKSAVEYAEGRDMPPFKCYCDLITALLNPDAPRSLVIVAATEIARNIYNQKRQAYRLAQSLQAIALAKGRSDN